MNTGGNVNAAIVTSFVKSECSSYLCVAASQDALVFQHLHEIVTDCWLNTRKGPTWENEHSVRPFVVFYITTHVTNNPQVCVLYLKLSRVKLPCQGKEWLWMFLKYETEKKNFFSKITISKKLQDKCRWVKAKALKLTFYVFTYFILLQWCVFILNMAKAIHKKHGLKGGQRKLQEICFR